MESLNCPINDFDNENFIDESEKEKLKEEMEEILKAVPYNLTVALIKICQIHDYNPLDMDSYYKSILPTFHLLRKTDGRPYTTQSVQTLKSAMFSNRLFFKTKEGLFALNISKALTYLKSLIQKKKPGNEKNETGASTSGNLEENILNNNGVMLKKEKKKKTYSQKLQAGPNFDFDQRSLMSLKKSKLKQKKICKPDNTQYKKYEASYELLLNLLKLSQNDSNIYSKLNFDFSDMQGATNLSEDCPNFNKIVGMLTVFKLFKPFLEKSFNMMKVQDDITEKISELNYKINSIDHICRAQDY